MLEVLRNSPYLKAKIVAGVEVTMVPDGSYAFKLMIIKKDKKSIVIDKALEDIKEWDVLVEQLPPRIPVSLSLDGKGVIHKKVEVNDNQKLLNQVIPNANPDHFYYQKIPVSDNSAFVSLVRKEVLDNLLDQFKELKLFVVSLFLGPLVCNSITSIIEHNGQLETDNSIMQIEDNLIQSINKNGSRETPGQYTLGEDTIQKSLIVTFASAFYYYFPFYTGEAELIDDISSREEYSYRQLFTYSLRAFLVLLFVILLVNYLLFNHYSKKENEFLLIYQKNRGQLTLIDTLKVQLTAKESLVQTNGLLTGSRLSYYADRLALSLPGNITLTKMVMNPVQNKIQNEKEISYSKNIIYIEGVASRSIDLHDWIETINQESWMQHVELLNYEQENTTIPGEFIIEINYN